MHFTLLTSVMLLLLQQAPGIQFVEGIWIVDQQFERLNEGEERELPSSRLVAIRNGEIVDIDLGGSATSLELYSHERIDVLKRNIYWKVNHAKIPPGTKIVAAFDSSAPNNCVLRFEGHTATGEFVAATYLMNRFANRLGGANTQLKLAIDSFANKVNRDRGDAAERYLLKAASIAYEEHLAIERLK